MSEGEAEQGLAGVRREALAGLGEAEEAQALGMAEEGAVVVGADFIVGGGFGNGHRSTSGVIPGGLTPCVSRCSKTRRSIGPSKTTRTAPAAAIPACSSQKQSGVIC